jgi:O-antigen/teichoic acid export membrane protein
VSFSSGADERRLAIGSVAQQGTQLLVALASLAVITVLARELSFAGFGVYTLFVSFSTYLLFAQSAVEGAAVSMLAGAGQDDAARARVFSTTVVAYSLAGLVAGLLIALASLVLPGPLGVPEQLQDDALLGGVLTGALAVVGWPLKSCRDALRAAQLFRRVALSDFLGYFAMAALSIGLAVAGAPLWLLIAVGGAVPLFIGLAAGVIFALARGLGLRLAPGTMERATTARFMRMSSQLLATGVADFVIYSLDRVVLSAFKGSSAVGLYEGPLRVHNLVRLTAGTLSFGVLPAASDYLAKGDTARARDLLVRGTRYVLALVVPGVVVVMVLAGPILSVWLGPRFATADTAMTIFVGYWLINANTVVAAGMLVAHGETAWLARYAWSVALGCLAASLALTPLLGLEGLVLGTAIPYAVSFPFFVRFALSKLPATLGDLARRAWLPAYPLAALLALTLIGTRAAFDLDRLGEVLAVGLGGLAAYWLVFAALFLDASERRLAVDVVRGMLRAG